MTRTTKIDRRDLAATLEYLRSQGASDEVVAAVSVTFDDLAFTAGNTQEELDELRAKVPASATFTVVRWIVVHGRIEL
jgi:hypothetical protein